LNDYFEGSHGHHTHRNGNHSEIIFIPYELHKQHYHDHNDQYSMNRINTLIYEWYYNNYGVKLYDKNLG